MQLVIGGAHQGKLHWVLQQTGYTQNDVASTLLAAMQRPVLNALHEEVRKCLQEGISPQELVKGLLDRNPEVIILCDEIGCGVVPVDAFERAWREETGRICCMLAEKAVRVDRIFCGLATCIKPGVHG